MKKFCAIVLVCLITLSLTACGRRKDNTNNNNTILPTMDPTIATNIPDPDVDTKMPMYTNGMDEDIITMPTMDGNTSQNNARSGR